MGDPGADPPIRAGMSKLATVLPRWEWLGSPCRSCRVCPCPTFVRRHSTATCAPYSPSSADNNSGGPSFAAAYARQRALVSFFLDGPAHRSQARLVALDKISPHNWLDDNFWTKITYLEWRAPLLVNSDWWLTFVNEPNVPSEVVTSHVEGMTPSLAGQEGCLPGYMASLTSSTK